MIYMGLSEQGYDRPGLSEQGTRGVSKLIIDQEV